ncbi:MAG: response regulator transcription factor [Sphingomonas sp.]|uniref:response regulator transcription factor n=1 Tax=Sphingomonas sp. TaxID=28214 RepID=UPI0025FDF84D|nr:response regulator transcription factor [Sphingomonas sp.]MBX3566334.1 response regulator transcription factor [Sphingomonas sp.]
MTEISRLYLVVEDIAETRDWLVANIAEIFGAVAHAAPTLRDARIWLRQRDSQDLILALVDLGLPDGNGVDFIEEIVGRCPDALVVVTTVFDDDESLMEALGAGAQGYLLKDQDATGIAHRLAMIDHGEVPISPAIARRLLQRFRADEPSNATLSPRETEVLRLIGRGLKSGEVAGVLSISPQTVTTHVKTIYRKLEITSRAEAALEARKRGLA